MSPNTEELLETLARAQAASHRATGYRNLASRNARRPAEATRLLLLACDTYARALLHSLDATKLVLEQIQKAVGR